MRRALIGLLLIALVGACGGETARPRAGGQARRGSPGTRSSSVDVAAASYETSPPRFRFAVVGDFGTGGPAEYAVARRMCARHDRLPLRMVVTTGDNIYPNDSPDRFGPAFFEPFACLFDRGVPWHATLGNHDVQAHGGRFELSEPAFGMAGRNYVVRRPGIRFVLADSNALKLRWLRRGLKRAREERWTVVAFHHPVYSPGSHGSTPGLAPRLPRMFRRWGVDLVLNGHDHLYSASRGLRGIRYVVTGGGGAPLYTCGQRWFTAVCSERHHFLEVTASAERMVVRAVPASGRPFHVFATRGVRPLR